MSVHLGLTLPSNSGYGSIKPSFGVEVDVPKGVDPDEFKDTVLLPWVLHNLYSLLRRNGRMYVKATESLPNTVSEYFEKHPTAPKLEYEVREEAE